MRTRTLPQKKTDSYTFKVHREHCSSPITERNMSFCVCNFDVSCHQKSGNDVICASAHVSSLNHCFYCTSHSKAINLGYPTSFIVPSRCCNLKLPGFYHCPNVVFEHFLKFWIYPQRISWGLYMQFFSRPPSFRTTVDAFIIINIFDVRH